PARALHLRRGAGVDPARRHRAPAHPGRVHQLPNGHAERDGVFAPAGVLVGALLLLSLLGAAPLEVPMPPPPPPSREAWALAEVSLGGSVLARGAAFCAAPLQPWCGKDANLVYFTSLPYL